MGIDEFLKKLKYVANLHEHYTYLDDQIASARIVTDKLKKVIEEYEVKS